MSSNLSVINFTVGGTLSISGKTTLAETILSSSTASFQGVSTTSLTTTGTSTFTSLPTSTQTPILDSQLTTKVYVDNADKVVNKRITDTDSDQRIYIDGSYNALNKRITDTDLAQKTYIDASLNALDTSLTNKISSQYTKENTWSEVQLFSKLPYVGIDLTPSRSQDLTPKSYVDTSIRDTQQKPVFYVFFSNSQTIANNTLSRIFFRNKVFNLFDKYDINNDFTFTPSLSYSGYYNLSTTISFPNITSGYIAIYKNGVEYSRSNTVSSATPIALSLSISTIMYFKNINDFADVRLFCTPSNILVSGQPNSFFTGSFIQNLFGSES